MANAIIGYTVVDISTGLHIGEPYPVGSDRLAAREQAASDARKLNRAKGTSRYTFRAITAE